MDKSGNKKISEQIYLLQAQVDQIQIKVFEEKKHKWYKNPSLILSIIAVISSLFFSVNAIIDKQQSVKSEKASTIIKSLKESITQLIDEEKEFLQITSNQTIDAGTKNSAYLSYQAKSGYLIDKTSSMLDAENIKQLEPNLLLNYGRFLSNAGKYEDSKYVFEEAIRTCMDSLTKGICYRSIANIFANPSFNKSNPNKSREFRKKDILLAKTFNGERKSDYLSRSYELWALDEYYFLNSISEGNRLIDSALFYVKLFPDMNQNKTTFTNRLSETYDFYNNILVPNQISGEYSFHATDGKIGRAYIITNSFGSSINIDFIKNNKLYGRLSGNGNLINSKDLKYEVRLEIVDEFNKPNYSGGTLNLKTKKDKKLTGKLFEFGKDPVKYELTKI